MLYDDLSIQLGPTTAEGIHVKVSCVLGGDETGTLTLSCTPAAMLAAFARAVGPGSRNMAPVTTEGPTSMTAEEIGDTLFSSVFRNGALGVLDRSLGSLSRERERGVRFRVKTDLRDSAQAELLGLPWELLRLGRTGSFLGLGRRTPVVRYLEVPKEIRPRRLPDRLRIVVLASQPRGVRPLDVEAEAQSVKDLERRIEGVEVEILPRADLDTLRSFLLDRGADIVHFIGHGDHDERAGTTFLYLEARDGSAEAVETREIVQTLDDLDDLRLVVVNACDTGRFGAGQPFAALAPALLQAGLPAVLAMQRPILDEAAVRFTDTFYRRLSAGDPVDSAVTEGRLALARNKTTAKSWPIPALFMRTADGELFTAEAPQAASLPPIERRPTWRSHLEARSWDAARDELRRQLALDPHAPGVTSALAVALARGGPLRRLRYATALEMHRLLVAGLALPDDRRIAADCLIALKLEYFQPNAVREPEPTLDDVLEVAESTPRPSDANEVLEGLHTTDRVREIWARIERTQRGS